MVRIKKIFCVLLFAVMIACSILQISAAGASASLNGPDKLELGGELKISFCLNGNGEKAVSGQLNYDRALLILDKIETAAIGWKTETSLLEEDGIVYFAAADESDSNPVRGSSVIFTATFSKKFLEVGNQVTVRASSLTTSAGKGTETLEDCVYQKKVTEIQEISAPKPDNTANESAQSGQTTDSDPLNEIRLKSLSVKEADIDPEFEPDTKSYEITVPADCKKITVAAEPMDSESTVTVTDENLIYADKNITKIVVTGKSGSKRTYKIYTYKKGAAEISESKKQDSNSILPWILTGAGILVLAAAISVILLFLKRKREKDGK